jgi:adenylate cyclase class 2
VYSFGDVGVSIDEWPKLPPIMEIEADSEAKVRDALNKLNIKGKELGNIGWEKVYAMHGMDLRSFKILKFDDKEERYD